MNNQNTFFVVVRDGVAEAEAIQAGENLIPFFERWKPSAVYIVRSRSEADRLVRRLNAEAVR